MCLSEETPMKVVLILTHATKRSAEQTSMRAKWFNNPLTIATVQEHLLLKKEETTTSLSCLLSKGLRGTMVWCVAPCADTMCLFWWHFALVLLAFFAI